MKMKAKESEDTSVNKKAKPRVIKFILRTFIIWIGQVIGFIIIADIGVGLTINNWATGLIVVGILGIINALFWPILSRYFLPFLIYTVGIGSLLINGLIIC